MNLITKLQSPEFWIENSLQDLYFLCRNVLSIIEDPTPGFKDLYRPTHKLICDFVSRYAYDGQKVILMCPRHWIKSYLITIGWTIQRILRNLTENRREFFVICNAVLSNARDFLYKIKFNFQYNDLLKALFRPWLPEDFETKAEIWTQDVIQLSGNRIEIGSVEKSLTSKHFKVGLNDDLVDWENTKTPERILTVIDWWKLYQSLLSPDGLEIIPGTRYVYDDLYGYILKQFLKIPRAVEDEGKKKPVFEWHNGNYHYLRISCWEDPVAKKGSTYPTLFPEERLKQLMLEQQERFGGQYMLDPLDMSNAKFKQSWIKYFDEHELPPIRWTAMLVDPTGKEKAGSDYTGMVVAEPASDKKVYVRFGKRKLITDLKLAEWIIEVALQYQPDQIGIEENKFQTLTEILELIIPQKIKRGEIAKTLLDYVKTIPNICVELRHRGRPKHVRIENLTGWIESGRFVFQRFGTEDLIGEIVSYGGTKTNDTLDALAYMLDLLYFPQADEPEKKFVLPEELKMTDEQRLRKEWEEDLERIQSEREAYFKNIQDLY